MNTQERAAINARLAELCGWKWKRDQAWLRSDPEKKPVGRPYRYWAKPDSLWSDLPDWDGKEDCDVRPELGDKPPDYCSNGDAAREAAGRLPAHLRTNFLVELGNLVIDKSCRCYGGETCERCAFNCVLATPEQISRAVYAALGATT